MTDWLDSPAFGLVRPKVRNTNLIKPVKIGSVVIPNNLVLAPMAGVTDYSFRLLCSRLGAGLTVSELASAQAIVYQNRQTLQMIRSQALVRPYAVQLFGADHEMMLQAAKYVENMKICDMIDINMGCPVNKVVKTGAGAAMMKEPDNASKIVKKLADNISLPITVKCRLGWTEKTINAESFVEMMVDSGASAVTLHARTRQAGYSGKAQWQYFDKVAKLCKSVPFFVNGDISSVEDIEHIAKNCDCDGYMIGRSAVGKPWLFSELIGDTSFLDAKTKFRIFKHHLVDMLMEQGSKAVPMFRVHLFEYIRNHPDAAKMRQVLSSERDPLEIIKTGEEFFMNKSV